MSDMLFIIGGVALAAIIFYALYEAYRKQNNEEPSSVSDLVNNMADEQLVVDHLEPKELTSWFRTKNADNSKKNVLIYPNLCDMNSFKLPENIELDADNIIIQALLDKNDNIFLCRSVIFSDISEKLQQIFKDNDGVIIVE